MNRTPKSLSHFSHMHSIFLFMLQFICNLENSEVVDDPGMPVSCSSASDVQSGSKKERSSVTASVSNINVAGNEM